MLKLKSLEIQEMRGIRNLTLALNQKSFAVSGPNGSGKSGVIDAIEFGLTGQITRLAGEGSKGLSLAEHAPHVDAPKNPKAAFVKLEVLLITPTKNKSATITRYVSAPKKPIIQPPDSDILTAFSEIAQHPEIALSRRELLRFVTVGASDRSKEVQALLKLEEVGQLRSTLAAARNRLKQQAKTAADQRSLRNRAFAEHLQVETLSPSVILDAVNARRALLNLAPIPELTANIKFDAGIAVSAPHESLNKESALRDLRALPILIAEFANLAAAELSAILAALASLESDPPLLLALQTHSLIEKGIDLIDGAACPLCELTWPTEQNLRTHLQQKLLKSQQAQTLLDEIRGNTASLQRKTLPIAALAATIQKIAEDQKESALTRDITAWLAALDQRKPKLATFEGLIDLKASFSAGWLQTPPNLTANLHALTAKIGAQPDQSSTLAAPSFLFITQRCLVELREAAGELAAAEAALQRAEVAYETYCEVMEATLTTLYQNVEDDFRRFYRIIHGDDEPTFTAKLNPSEGKLDLDVDFYGRGLFPPTAFHSEGHQDSMGVCLYLALMRRLFGNRFTFALLDDIVTSIDSAHRRCFCSLLKQEFPNTQFVITTHEQLWANQMKTEQLVSAETSVAFQNWTVDNGPTVESGDAVWRKIDESLTTGSVNAAASILRHHLEYAFAHLADSLGASVRYKSAGRYTLGDFQENTVNRLEYLYKKAVSAAGDSATKTKMTERLEHLRESRKVVSASKGIVNEAVHYSPGSDFSKNDFLPVVRAYKQLLSCFECAGCHSWLAITPRVGESEVLQCECRQLNFALIAAKGNQKSAASASS